MTTKQVIDELNAVADRMDSVADDLELYGASQSLSVHVRSNNHANEMRGAARMARDWAKGIEAEEGEG